MNVDEAMEVGAAKKNYQHLGLNHSEVACCVLHDEVERLRAEVQRLDIAGTHFCHDDCPKLPCVQRREIEQLRAELAKANEKIKSQQLILHRYKTGKGWR